MTEMEAEAKLGSEAMKVGKGGGGLGRKAMGRERTERGRFWQVNVRAKKAI